MALEDQKRNFEKALGSKLRSKGQRGWDCPDAETLAAYHERMLSPEEMSEAKTHIVACARCQEILAALEMTETIPCGVEDKEKVAGKAAVLEGAQTKGSSSLREMPKAKPYRKWVVPAGAVAAGLLAWIAVSVNRPPRIAKQNIPIQVADSREQSLPAPKTELETRVPAPPKGQRAEANQRNDSKQELDAFAESQSKGAGRGRTAYDRGPRMAQNQAQNQIQTNRQRVWQNQTSDGLGESPSAGRNVTALEEKALGEPASKAAPAPQTPPAAEPTAKNEQQDLKVPSASEMVVVTGADASVLSEEKSDKDKSAAKKKLNAAQSVGGVAAAYMGDSGAGNTGFVRTPDPKVFWVFTATGLVMKSEDGGKTARLQKTGEGMKFLAGSAPDRKTCWLLAEKGIVLRTADGGKTWLAAVAPADMNFRMITAFDRTHALVTDVGGKVSYSTADGGASWNKVPER